MGNTGVDVRDEWVPCMLPHVTASVPPVARVNTPTHSVLTCAVLRLWFTLTHLIEGCKHMVPREWVPNYVLV